MKETKRKLNLAESLRYHIVSIIILSSCALCLINRIITQKPFPKIETPEKISFVLICFVVLMFWKKNRNLKFETFQTNLSVDGLKSEIENLADKFDWIRVSSSTNQYEFKIKISSNYSLNTLSLSQEEERYLNAIIKTYPKQFQLNIILDLESGIIDGLGEKKQWRNKIINTLTSQPISP